MAKVLRRLISLDISDSDPATIPRHINKRNPDDTIT
jgi:hypothetical protein